MSRQSFRVDDVCLWITILVISSMLVVIQVKFTYHQSELYNNEAMQLSIFNSIDVHHERNQFQPEISDKVTYSAKPHEGLTNGSVCPVPYTYSQACNVTIISPLCCGGSSHGELVINNRIAFTWKPDSLLHFFVISNTCQLQSVNISTDSGSVQELTTNLRRMPKRTAIAASFHNNIKYTHKLLVKLGIRKSKLRPIRYTDGYVTVAGLNGYLGHLVYDIVNTTNKRAIATKVYHFGVNFNVHIVRTTQAKLLMDHTDISRGGSWEPPNCTARWRVAIIIPYRNREIHLFFFLENMLRFLKLQYIAFTMFVIEQEMPEIFNRASLMNIGYLEASARGRYDCFVFHDVDMVPEDLSNLYACDHQPRLLLLSRSVTSYRIRDQDYVYFGGAIMLNAQQIHKMNGFTNQIFGWGGEDDEMYERLRIVNYSVLRYPNEVGTYSCFKHGTDVGNPHKGRSVDMMKVYARQNYLEDGLNSAKYNMTLEKKTPLFTHIRVRLSGPRNDTEHGVYMEEFNNSVFHRAIRDWYTEMSTAGYINSSGIIQEGCRDLMLEYAVRLYSGNS